VDQKGIVMSTDKKPVLTARGIVKRYGRVTALDQADFDLYPGEVLAVIGDNGAGKSSLIKALSGAITVDEGTIELDGKPVRFSSPMEAREAGIETVYQNLALSPACRLRITCSWGASCANRVLWANISGPLTIKECNASRGKSFPSLA
jgi:ABC-type sugar transport system ATPase subunit